MQNYKQILKEFFKSKIVWITTIIFTLFWVVSNVFYPIDLFLFPVWILVFALFLTAPFYLLYGIIILVGNKDYNSLLKISKIYIPFIITFFISIPAGSFDENQRLRTGKILSNSLQIYIAKHGSYPKAVSDLSIADNIQKPILFNWHRNNIVLANDSLLVYPTNIFDRFVWDNKAQKWTYEDF